MMLKYCASVALIAVVLLQAGCSFEDLGNTTAADVHDASADTVATPDTVGKPDAVATPDTLATPDTVATLDTVVTPDVADVTDHSDLLADPGQDMCLNAVDGTPCGTGKTCQAGLCQPTAAPRVTGVTRNGDVVDIAMGPDHLILQACAQGLLKVLYQPGGVSTSATEVLAEVDCPPAYALIEEDADPIVIATTAMSVKVARIDGRLSVFDATGRSLLQGQDEGGGGQGSLHFTHDPEQNFYGIGESTGLLRNAGLDIRAGSQGYAGGPLVWSTARYGLVVDSDGGRFVMDSTNLRFVNDSMQDLKYFILVGEPAQMMGYVAIVSGRTPMYPKWALGFMNSQWNITQTELASLIDTYRTKQIPIDAFILDFDWKDWGSDDYGEWRWNTTKFPDGPSGALKAAMDLKGVKLGGIMKPRILVDSIQGNYATDHGFWIPGRAPVTDYFSHKIVNSLDFSVPDCRAWFFEHAEPAFDTGIVGWWNDEADDYTNFQFLNMQKALYDGQRAYSDLRVFSLNRNFYLGSQKYAYGLWSGDIGTSFSHMAAQRGRMLSAISVGVTKWSMDVGGFKGTPGSENYARWMQFGAFVPIFRVHGTQGQKRQPWVYGTVAEAAAKNAILLRYRLLPYIYSYERRAYDAGVGVVKPLHFDYPDDPNVKDDVDAWMFGDFLLVSPVMVEGSQSQSIYLPAGTWIDYFKGDRVAGAQTITYPIDSETWEDIPLFIKLGAIIPSQDVLNYVGESAVTTVYVDIFPDTVPSSFRYYDDDGSTYGYEEGIYFSQEMRAEDFVDRVEFEIAEARGTYVPDLQYYICKIHDDGGTGEELTVNGAAIPRVADLADLSTTVGEGWATGSDLYGSVVWVKVAAGSKKKIILR